MNKQPVSVSKNNLLLDVRNSEEIDEVKYNNETNEFKHILYIPSTSIKYNLDFLHDYFTQFDNVYIICRSGARSKKIKDKYFSKNENVYVNSIHFNTLPEKETIKNPGWHLSTMRKIQIISGSIIILLFTLMIFVNNNVKYAFLVFGLVMIYVGVSGNCFMSSILSKDDV
jgi:rhodanese-related sulfurtransferase